MVDAISKVKQYNNKGELIREISLPGVGTASGFGGKKSKLRSITRLLTTKRQARLTALTRKAVSQKYTVSQG